MYCYSIHNMFLQPRDEYSAMARHIVKIFHMEAINRVHSVRFQFPNAHLRLICSRVYSLVFNDTLSLLSWANIYKSPSPELHGLVEVLYTHEISGEQYVEKNA